MTNFTVEACTLTYVTLRDFHSKAGAICNDNQSINQSISQSVSQSVNFVNVSVSTSRRNNLLLTGDIHDKIKCIHVLNHLQLL